MFESKITCQAKSQYLKVNEKKSAGVNNNVKIIWQKL